MSLDVFIYYDINDMRIAFVQDETLLSVILAARLLFKVVLYLSWGLINWVPGLW